MIKMVMFDLDGTLLDTVYYIGYSCNVCLKKLGFKEHDIRKYKYFSGDGVSNLLERALIEAGDIKLTKLEELRKIYLIELEKNQNSDIVKSFEHIDELLAKLKEKNILITVCTNKNHNLAVKAIDDFFGKGYFDYVLGVKDEKYKKPSNYMPNSIMDKFDISNEEVLYVGDTDTDIKTAKNAKLLSVGVTWGFRDKEELEKEKADFIVDSPLEILNILDKIGVIE